MSEPNSLASSPKHVNKISAPDKEIFLAVSATHAESSGFETQSEVTVSDHDSSEEEKKEETKMPAKKTTNWKFVKNDDKKCAPPKKP